MLECHFSPDGNCAAKIVDLIGTATKELRVIAYSFTHKDIAAAIISKAKISTFIQDSRAAFGPGSRIDDLFAAKVKCNLDHLHAITHDKFILIDERLLITGSYNFTIGAELHNAENIIILDDPGIISSYIANFQFHLSHSLPYDPATAQCPMGLFASELTQE